eukprot:15155811-Alexandrium_andersonii.AAC.1
MLQTVRASRGEGSAPRPTTLVSGSARSRPMQGPTMPQPHAQTGRPEVAPPRNPQQDRTSPFGAGQRYQTVL